MTQPWCDSIASERTVWTFHSPGQIVFGRDSIQRLGELAVQLGGGRAMVVSDPYLQQAGLINRIQQPLRDAGIAVDVFADGEPEPSMDVVVACAQAARSRHANLLIALGGGSNMDLAKVAAVVLSHGGHPRDYVGDQNVPGPIVPLICVPTTAGTGSEVSFAAVLKDTDKNTKCGILSNYLRPRAAVVDPMLTVTCPPRVTADSGIDALTHAIEAFTAVDNASFPLPPGEKTVYQGKHPLGDVLAAKAIELVGRFLRRAVADGNDLEAREGMSLAALLAGLAFSNVGVAAAHAMEYALGGAFHCSHGAANGLLLPHVMRFNLPARTKEMADIARLLGEETTGMDEQQAAECAISAVQQLCKDIGLPQRLRDIGVQLHEITSLADSAARVQRVLRVNPRKMEMSDLEAVFRAAY